MQRATNPTLQPAAAEGAAEPSPAERARPEPGDDPVACVARAHFEFFDRNPDLLRILHQVRGVLKFRRPEWRPLRRDLEAYFRAMDSALGGRGAGRVAASGAAGRRARLLFGTVSGICSVHAALGQSLGGAAGHDALARGVSALIATARDGRSPRRELAVGRRRARPRSSRGRP